MPRLAAATRREVVRLTEAVQYLDRERLWRGVQGSAGPYSERYDDRQLRPLRDTDGFSYAVDVNAAGQRTLFLRLSERRGPGWWDAGTVVDAYEAFRREP